jgi:hypothetical protein
MVSHLPVAYGKAHSVANQNDCDNGIRAKFSIAVNAVAERELTACSDRGT